MEKPANNQFPVHDLIKKRWSPRAFSDRIVTPETVLSLLESARWAPSSFNEQPWSFIIAMKSEQAEYDRLLSCLYEGNQSWAKAAPVLILSIAKLSFSENQKPNHHALHDVGLAVGNLITQATAQGLSVHQMAGFQNEKARELYGIPEGHEPVTAIAVGYSGNAEDLPAPLREREKATRFRNDLETFVFSGRFGKSSFLLKRNE